MADPVLVERTGPLSSRESSSAQLLVNSWGEPLRVRSRGGDVEYWRYRMDISVSGLMLIVGFIPVPILLPTGRHYVEIGVSDGEVVSATGTTDGHHRGFCGFGMVPGYDLYGCHRRTRHRSDFKKYGVSVVRDVQKIQRRFGAGTRTDAVRFVRGDAVRAKSGPHAGRTGVVIGLVQLDPEVTFFIADPGTSPRGNLWIPQSDLELVEQRAVVARRLTRRCS